MNTAMLLPVFAWGILIFCGCARTEFSVPPANNALCMCNQLPFMKNEIIEIRIRYWVRVRERGVYGSEFDSGIRERIVVIRSKREIEKLLNELCIVSKESVSVNDTVNLVFLTAKNVQNYGKILNDTEILMMPGTLFTLRNYKFPVFCTAICALAESNIRSEAIGEKNYVDLSWIAFDEEKAENLKTLEYNRNADGSTHDYVRRYYHGLSPEEEKY